MVQGSKGSLVEFGHMGSVLNADWLSAKGPPLYTTFCSYCQISAFEEPIKHAPLLMLDSNITQEAIDHACSFCAANHIPGKKKSKGKAKS